MIHVIATITLKPGTRARFLEIFHRLAPQVHAEDGCLDYGPTVDVETGLDAQGTPRADVVTVVEKWASVPHLKAHLAAPHMDAFREEAKDLIAGIALVVTEPA